MTTPADRLATWLRKKREPRDPESVLNAVEEEAALKRIRILQRPMGFDKKWLTYFPTGLAAYYLLIELVQQDFDSAARLGALVVLIGGWTYRWHRQNKQIVAMGELMRYITKAPDPFDQMTRLAATAPSVMPAKKDQPDGEWRSVVWWQPPTNPPTPEDNPHG